MKISRKLKSLGLVAIICVGLVGCASTDASSDKSDTNQTVTKGYPVELTTYNYNGDEVKTTYDKAPEKVLAVYQGSIETMLELGLEDKLVAAAGLDNELEDKYKEAFDKVEYLTEFTPSKETVTMLNPDMILTWGSLFSDDNLGDVNTWIEIDAALEASKNQKSQNVLIVEFLGNDISNYGENSLGGDMVKSLGGNLVAKSQSKLGKEDIVSLNPDVIYVVYMPYSGDDPQKVKQENLDKLLKDESFKSLDAVKNGRVVPLMLGDMYASGVRTANGIETISQGLYPSLNK